MLEHVLERFGVKGDAVPFGDGHINSTYKVGEYVLQRINTNVFTNPSGVMKNSFAVTEHIRKMLNRDGENSFRQTVEFLHTLDGKDFYEGIEGVYRMYKFIPDSYTVSSAKTPELLYEAAKVMGKFQSLLADFDAKELYTVIPDFHNTPKRIEAFKKSLENANAERVEIAKKLISFALENQNISSLITDSIENGTVPVRVSHNDTKLNNFLFDNKTNKGLCLIDLDTVMDGSYLYDFGDAMRFGAAACDEDCTDESRIYFDLELFEVFTKGYLESAKNVLTEREKELIFMSVVIMTYECGTRFLTDYLNGDVYFKVAYPTHNLDRALNQYTLVKDMISKKEQAENIVKKYL